MCSWCTGLRSVLFIFWEKNSLTYDTINGLIVQFWSIHLLSPQWSRRHVFPVFLFLTCVCSQTIKLKKCHFPLQTVFNFDMFWNGMELFLLWSCGLDREHTSEIRLQFSLDAKPHIFKTTSSRMALGNGRFIGWTSLFDDAYWINSADTGTNFLLSVLVLLLTLYCLSFSALKKKTLMQQIPLTLLLYVEI